MKQFVGTGVALVTPFKSDKTIDYQALECLVEQQISAGIDYLVALGSTAEAITLNQQEQEKVKQTIMETTKKRVPLVLGLSDNNTSSLVEKIEDTNISGFDAILSVVPPYNKPTQQGLFEHFMQLAKATEKPIILYNVPSRTGANLLPETVLRLANASDKFIGIKEAAGDMVQALKLQQSMPQNFLVISGDDMIALPMVLSGGAGVISVLGQAYPKAFSTMIKMALQGESQKAYDYHYAFMDMIDLIFEQGNPVGIKALLELQQKIKNTREVRLPLVKATQELFDRIRLSDENILQFITAV